MFNSKEYEWSDITVTVAGRIVTGFRGIKYTSKQEKELLYGKGNKPVGIQCGNKDYSGSLVLLQSEYEALKASAAGDVLNISFDIIVGYGNPSKGDAIVNDAIIGCQITEDDTDWKQGDKFIEKSLPFIFLNKKSI